MNTITTEQCWEYIRLPKRLYGPMEWRDKPSNSAYRQCILQPVFDREDVAQQGLEVRLQYRIPQLIDACKESYTLFLWMGHLHRIFQIEVVPHEEKASRQHGKHVYGPHYHVNDHDVVDNIDNIASTTKLNVKPESLACGEPEKCFRAFLDLCNIELDSEFEYVHPMTNRPVDLF